jgi:hypothetical protein
MFGLSAFDAKPRVQPWLWQFVSAQVPLDPAGSLA